MEASTIRNHSPMHYPTGILTRVLEFACAETAVLLPFCSTDPRFRLRLVSRTWNEIITSNTALWAVIAFTAPSQSPHIQPNRLLGHFNICITRSGLEPLSIAFDTHRIDWPFSIVQSIILPNIRRVQKLTCLIYSNQEISAFMTIPNGQFAALESLDISFINTWDTPLSLFPPGTAAHFNSLKNAPRLCSLAMRLYNGFHPFDDLHLSWRKLTALDLGTRPMPSEVAVQILRCCKKRLQEAFFFVRFGRPYASLGNLAITMRALKKFRIRIMHPSCDIRLFSFLHLPILEDLWIEMFDEAYYQRWEPHLLEDILRSCSTSLQELRLSDFLPAELGYDNLQQRRHYEMTHHILENMFSLTPNLHTLRLPLGLPIHVVTMEKLAACELLPRLRVLELATSLDSGWHMLSIVERRREHILRTALGPGKSVSTPGSTVDDDHNLSSITHLSVYLPCNNYSGEKMEAFESKRHALEALGSVLFARKELNFERMTERDRKQIVAEVNILKDLHHDHIVRYHDRFVDREAGILYILMEYCGGGDLSAVIKHAARANRLISEETVWNYLYQLLQALFHCHHPNGHGRSSSGNTVDLAQPSGATNAKNAVKLGDFGLSKALAQVSFANTYVGTPYYMSPELTQEKAYDSKSDIWSLGCLIYELCALKPPFYDARTHGELSILIRNGRIPPLPRGYSQSLTAVIKSMLSLNPAMRPSASQLLQHERLELVAKITEAEKMLVEANAQLTLLRKKEVSVKKREEDLFARDRALEDAQDRMDAIIHDKNARIRELERQLQEREAEVADLRRKEEEHVCSPALVPPPAESISEFDPGVREIVTNAVARREAELRALVAQQETNARRAMRSKQDEIMRIVSEKEAEVMERESEMYEALRAMEARLRSSSDDTVQKSKGRPAEDVEVKKMGQESCTHDRAENKPLDDLTNTVDSIPLPRAATQPNHIQIRHRRCVASSASSSASSSSSLVPASDTSTSSSISASFPPTHLPTLALLAVPSMNNLVLADPETALDGIKASRITTEREDVSARLALGAPHSQPLNLLYLFDKNPWVKLDFQRVFDIGKEKGEEKGETVTNHSTVNETEKTDISYSSSGEDFASSQIGQCTERLCLPQPPAYTHLRRPSIDVPIQRENGQSASSIASSPSSSERETVPEPNPCSHPRLTAARNNSNLRPRASSAGILGGGPVFTRPVLAPRAPSPAPRYSPSDDENLPSRFLRRDERTKDVSRVYSNLNSTGDMDINPSATIQWRENRRMSSGLALRAAAAANSAGRRQSSLVIDEQDRGSRRRSVDTSATVQEDERVYGSTRPWLAGVRKAGEEARRALLPRS
ncbi:hypothetical protein BDN70DRAFT_996778 [Pholiota conissans]|uniref:non-specific serine/threonine protein kinase n=1 Tax=Pholiota conissans TaxID=109636 RepID=A0A9P5YTL4_9AGAR|nr:hypothetical protein BDN70DRAFT_996778 [Pholiota conissans]